MPRVPQYQTGQVDQAALPNARQSSVASPELFAGINGSKALGDLGEGLSRASVAGLKIVSDLQDKEDTAVLTGLESELLNRTTQFKLDASQKKGLNATNLAQEADDYWESTSTELLDMAKNDRQKAALTRIIQKHQPSFRGSIGSHVVQELNNAQESGFKASLETFQSSAAADPTTAADMKARINTTLDAWSSVKGWDAQTKERAKTEELTKMHMGVIGSLEAAGEIDAAKAYYYTNKKEIDGKEQIRIENALTKSGMEKKSQEAVDALMAMEMSEPEALDYIEKNYSGEEEKQIKQEFKMRRADLYSAAIKIQNENNDKAWDIYGKTGSLRNIPREVRDGMDPKMWITLRDKAQNDADAKLGNGDGFAKNGDPDLYSQLRYAAMDDPQKFAEVDMRQYITKLNKSMYESLLDIQAAAKKGDTAKLGEVRTVDGQINASLAPFKSMKSSEKQIIEDRIRKAVDDEQQALGKKLNADERQKIIDRQIMEGEVVTGKWFKPDVNVMFYEVVGTPDENKFVPFIPSAEKDKIKEALTRAKRPVTDAEIMKLYKQKMGIK